MRENAILGPAQKCPYHVTFDLDLEHTLDASTPVTIVCKFGLNRAICVQENAILGRAQKCPYHVTFDLDHTLDAGSPVDQRVQVWSQSSYLRARKCDFRSSTKVPVSRDL